MKKEHEHDKENCEVCKQAQLFRDIVAVAPQFRERLNHLSYYIEEQSNDLCVANVRVELLTKLCKASLSELMEVKDVI